MRSVKKTGGEIAGGVSGMFTVWWIREGDGGGQNRRKGLIEKRLSNISICVSAHGPAGAIW